MVEEILLNIAGVRPQTAMRVGGELGRSPLTALPHRQENSVNPGVDRHGVEPFVGEKENAVGHFHANAGEHLESLAETRRRLFRDGLEVDRAIGEQACGFKEIFSPVA